MSLDLNIGLVISELLSHREPNLFFDEVNAGDTLGDSMLDLDACVHFQEIEIIIFIHNKLNSSSIRVADRFCGFCGGFTDIVAKFRWN